jgi:hypothetical protein
MLSDNPKPSLGLSNIYVSDSEHYILNIKRESLTTHKADLHKAENYLAVGIPRRGVWVTSGPPIQRQNFDIAFS